MKALITHSDGDKGKYTKKDIKEFSTIEGLLAFEKEVDYLLIIIGKEHSWYNNRCLDGITTDDFDFVIEIYNYYRE